MNTQDLEKYLYFKINEAVLEYFDAVQNQEETFMKMYQGKLMAFAQVWENAVLIPNGANLPVCSIQPSNVRMIAKMNDDSIKVFDFHYSDWVNGNLF